MTDFTLQMMYWGAGMILGAYLMKEWLAFTTRKKRRARQRALQEIASHKWDTGEHNDAVVITRIAIRGLEGE